MVSSPPLDTVLRPINTTPRPLAQYLTTFHLVLVVLDPFTNESAWVLDTAGRVLTVFAQADARMGWLVAGTPEECREFLGPWATRFLTFADPDRDAVKALGLDRVPAIVHLAMDGSVVSHAEGWQPAAWQVVVDELAQVLSWKAPRLPDPRDPAPYEGTPALG